MSCLFVSPCDGQGLNDVVILSVDYCIYIFVFFFFLDDVSCAVFYWHLGDARTCIQVVVFGGGLTN